MGQTAVERGGEGLPIWALVLVALVVIALIVALLAWFTTGPGKGLSGPPQFSLSSPTVQPIPSPTGRAVTNLSRD